MKDENNFLGYVQMILYTIISIIDILQMEGAISARQIPASIINKKIKFAFD
jgi:hypothetical protein